MELLIIVDAQTFCRNDGSWHFSEENPVSALTGIPDVHEGEGTASA
jgi:hypothetical protein